MRWCADVLLLDLLLLLLCLVLSGDIAARGGRANHSYCTLVVARPGREDCLGVLLFRRLLRCLCLFRSRWPHRSKTGGCGLYLFRLFAGSWAACRHVGASGACILCTAGTGTRRRRSPSSSSCPGHLPRSRCPHHCCPLRRCRCQTRCSRSPTHLREGCAPAPTSVDPLPHRHLDSSSVLLVLALPRLGTSPG